MRHILLIFLLSLIPLSAQATIPLELVAEFNLPENATAWDVQHWMDDSTFGWAALRHDTVFFVEQLGAPIQAVRIDSSYLGSIGHDGTPTYSYINLVRLDANIFTPAVVVVSHISNRDSSEFEDTDNDYYLFVNLMSGEATPRFRYETYFDNDWYATFDRGISKIVVWPPPPLATESIRSAYWESTVYWFPYHTTYGGVFFEWQLDDESFHNTCAATNFDHFAGYGNGYALIYVEEGDVSTQSYRDLHIRRVLDGNDTLVSSLVCDSWWFANEDDPNECIYTVAVATSTRDGERRIVMGRTLYDAANLNQLSVFPQEYRPAFSLRVSGFPDDLLWGYVAGHRLRAWNSELTFVDTTTTFGPASIQVQKGLDGHGYLVASLNGTYTKRIYKPEVRVSNLTLSYNSFTDLLDLSWSPLPLATSYQICRSQYAEGDFCEQDIISVADTFLTLPLINGVNREFFRVRALFE